MTTQKAVKVIDYTIESKIELRNGFTDPAKSWNYGEMNFSGITEQIARMLNDDLTILRFIRAQITPKCKHPKKMRDICEGVEYCMSCNLDLTDNKP